MSTDAKPIPAIVCFEQSGAAIEIAKSVAMSAAIDLVVSYFTKEPAKIGRKTIARGVGTWLFFKVLWPQLKPLAERGIAEAAVLTERMRAP